MSEGRRKEIESLFDKASLLPPDERSKFLSENCDDHEIRSEVEELLKFDEHQDGGLTGNAQDQLPQNSGNFPKISKGQPKLSDSSSTNAIDHGRFIPGTVLSSRYRIVGMLGQGGMGEVYKADDLELGQSVALKILPERLASDPRSLERFRSEVRLARQISHPNVCRVYDIGQLEDVEGAGKPFFLSMEYVDGEDLSQLLKRIGHFNPNRATELARQLCLGLHAAHERGVIHRDLKPANVMIDGRGKLLITDFGLAEFTDNVQEDDIRSGTPAYMSPEQLAGREVTELSDIFSLGIILHELFTGKPAWEANSLAELIEKRNSNASVSTTDHDLDPAIESVIEKCLEPAPEKRPSSALKVMASLPGGDPLAAALGAGEIPSPELVAAAGDNISTSTRRAITALITVFFGLILVMGLERNTSPVAHSELNYAPDRMKEKAQNILSHLLNGSIDKENSESESDDPIKNIEELVGYRRFPKIDSNPVSFYYRQRKIDRENGQPGFHTHSFWSSKWGKYSWGRPDFFNPTMDLPGESRLILSGDGKLVYYQHVPEQREGLQHPQTPKWSVWFNEDNTGFRFLTDDETETGDSNVKTFRKCEWLNWKPKDHFDEIEYWEQQSTKEDEQKKYVVTAAVNGKPTFFRIFYDEDVKKFEKGDKNAIKTIKESTRVHKSGPYVVWLVIIAMAFGIILAIRNLRSGRVDRRGGIRLAIYVAVINLIILLSFCRWLPFNPEDIYAAIITLGVATVLFETARIWMWYMAIEPFARKVWPQILITTSRLLSGRFLDPLVGRDILAGIFFCVLMTILDKLNILIHIKSEIVFQPPSLFIPLPVSDTDPREFIGTIFSSHGFAFFSSIFIVMVLLMARIIFRTEKRSFIAAVAFLSPLLTLMKMDEGDFYITIFTGTITAVCILFLLVRFGILALLAFYTCFNMLAVIPLTIPWPLGSDPIWYFERGLMTAGLVFGMAIAGYWLATSKNKRILRNRMLD